MFTKSLKKLSYVCLWVNVLLRHERTLRDICATHLLRRRHWSCFAPSHAPDTA